MGFSRAGNLNSPSVRGGFFIENFRERVVDVVALRMGLGLPWSVVGFVLGSGNPVLAGRSAKFWAAALCHERKAGNVPGLGDSRVVESVARYKQRLMALDEAPGGQVDGGVNAIAVQATAPSNESPAPSPVVERMRAASASDGRSTTFQVQGQGNQSHPAQAAQTQDPWEMLDAKIKAGRDISDKDCEDAGITPDPLIAYVKAYRARSFSNLGALMRKAVFDLALPYDKSVNDWFKECDVTNSYLEARSSGMKYPEALAALGS